MQRVYFISDVHLGSSSGEVERRKANRLTSFLKSLHGRADYLYIVGDLYDFWFEYRRAIPKLNLKVLAALIQLVESGTEVRYLTGNHDLWHESYLCAEIGLQLYHEPIEVTHNSLRLFIAHGDGLTAGEWKMRMAKKIMRSRFNIMLYRWLHPDLGLPLMRYVSRKSGAQGDNRFEQAYSDLAGRKHEEGFDIVILAHTHRPEFRESNGKYFVNLGDWLAHFTYLKLVGPRPEPATWRADTARHGQKLPSGELV